MYYMVRWYPHYVLHGQMVAPPCNTWSGGSPTMYYMVRWYPHCVLHGQVVSPLCITWSGGSPTMYYIAMQMNPIGKYLDIH